MGRCFGSFSIFYTGMPVMFIYATKYCDYFTGYVITRVKAISFAVVHKTNVSIVIYI